MNDGEEETDFSMDDLVPAGEKLAAIICALFRADEYDFGVALIVFSDHFLDPWTSGDKNFHKWRIEVPTKLFVEYKRQVEFGIDDWGNGPQYHANDFHDRAWRLGFEALKRSGLRKEDDILIEPSYKHDAEWRGQGIDYLKGTGLNNQGNVFLSNRPRIPHDELVFRTVSETYVHQALVQRKVIFMPLPVVMRNDGKKPRPTGSGRIEPDFVILYRGRTVVLEIDGGSHDQESPVDAQERLAFMESAGAYVERVRTDQCKDLEGALLAVNDVLKKIDKRIDARS